jgi:MFS transporter, DHA2 family, multidrug resistance protein
MDETEGLPRSARTRAIATIVIATATSTLTNTIANIALPTMAHELQATPSASIWVVNAYQLAVTVSLLPLASPGDIYGYRRVYLMGLVVFTLASIACGLADSLPLLVAARVGQAIGATRIMSVNTALIRFIFPPNQLGRGIFVTTLTMAVCSASVDRLGHPGVRVLALAVRVQRAAWRRRGLAGVEIRATHQPVEPPLRPRQRRAQRPHLRAPADRL